MDRAGAVVVANENVELMQLAEPARGAALHEQRLVVGIRVAVGRGVAQHREDASQQLVGGGHDGALLWNDSLVNPSERSAVGVAPDLPARLPRPPPGVTGCSSVASMSRGRRDDERSEGRFDDESRCYSVIITVARDSARMTVFRRESEPS